MSLSSVQDQEIPVRLLQSMLRRNRMPHGLLFWGPGGVGKSLVAAELAKALNCGEADADACDACLSCRKTSHSNHPDVKVVVPVGRARVIKVEAVEGINEMASLRPFEGEYRVFILQDAERMNESAQNHFLKTLEEPPGKSVFILVTEYPRQLLPTIRSRCQQIRFGALRPETVSRLLLRDHPELPQAEAEALAALSQGQMSRAAHLVSSEKRAFVLDLLQDLGAGKDPHALSEVLGRQLAAEKTAVEVQMKADLALDPAESTKEERAAVEKEAESLVAAKVQQDLMEYLYLLETWYRDVLVYQATGDPAQVWNRDQLSHLQSARLGDFQKKLEAIDKARLYLERFLNVDRVFRDLLFALAA
jgi:DNA polymerase-3 subunit delta'